MNYFTGYGIDLYEHYVEDTFPGLLAFAKKYTPDVYENIKKWLDEIQPDEEKEQMVVMRWFDNYELNGYAGISAYLASVINEQEGTQFCSHDIDCDCIYIPRLYPWQYNERMRSLTESEAVGLIRKYVKQITDLEYNITNIAMYEI